MFRVLVVLCAIYALFQCYVNDQTFKNKCTRDQTAGFLNICNGVVAMGIIFYFVFSSVRETDLAELG